MLLQTVCFNLNSPVKLHIDHDILIDFHNVPVAPQMLSYRSRCVIRCVFVCMHCYQQSPHWQSLNVKNHLTEFYALYATRHCTCLRSNWRASGKRCPFRQTREHTLFTTKSISTTEFVLILPSRAC
jgi:hypothetical protein